MKHILLLILTLFCIDVFAQTNEITETITNDFIPSRFALPDQRYLAEGDYLGVKSMKRDEYRDSITRYFDKIEEYYPPTKDTLVNRYFMAMFGDDTLCYKERKEIIRHQYSNKTTLEVESKVPPFQRFSTDIEGAKKEDVMMLIDIMQQRKTSDILINNSQTCIFYALHLLLDYHGINPAPIITRNTNFTDGHQLNALFDHMLLLKSSHRCSPKALRNIHLTDSCVLVFRNAHGKYIHAVFYDSDTKMFYTKNGMLAPFVLKDIRPLTEQYGRYTNKQIRLSQHGVDELADSVLVYVLQEKFGKIEGNL